MAKNRRSNARPSPEPSPSRRPGGVAVGIVLFSVAVALVVFASRRNPGESPKPDPANPSAAAPTTPTTPAAVGPGTPSAAGPTPAPTASAPDALPQMEVKQAVMVTVDLDFGGTVPTVAEALKEVERRHEPSDGSGRVFSILDAYQNPGAEGNQLRLSMHVSSEKTGVGSLVFRRTGKVLWRSRIVPTADGTTSVQPEGLTILIDNRAGGALMVDGSTNPANILQAKFKENGARVGDVWPDGDEREITFLYSACGCPVKVMCRRQGDRTIRTRIEPVIFPDDPAALEVINHLMGW